MIHFFIFLVGVAVGMGAMLISRPFLTAMIQSSAVFDPADCVKSANEFMRLEVRDDE